MKFLKNFKKLKGDASSRIFFRNKKKNSSSIIVYANKNKKSNLLDYDCINKILIKNKILAPKLLSENYSKNYIEIQDFGNQTIFSLFKKGSINKIKIYKQIIDLLNKLQSIRQKKIKNFRNKLYIIPTYTPRILEDEAKLFSDWYIDKKLKNFQKNNFKKRYYKVLKDLTKRIYLKNNTFVHRDFHISNLMMVNNEIAVIDSQDALIGNKAYDLASLIDDVRFETPESLKKRICTFYIKKNKILEKKIFMNDFEIISVLRNLKIIGIFTRLAVRDNKKKYLKLIPYAWKLIKVRSKNNNKFKDLNYLLNVIKNKN
tara:strand:+ start:591 stop:1535 length:945 start_codon:yes stop_codon:yes gene_type:complete